eukprot:15430127-Alexandrium_andersonii.AAC.1
MAHQGRQGNRQTTPTLHLRMAATTVVEAWALLDLASHAADVAAAAVVAMLQAAAHVWAARVGARRQQCARMPARARLNGTNF